MNQFSAFSFFILFASCSLAQSIDSIKVGNGGGISGKVKCFMVVGSKKARDGKEKQPTTCVAHKVRKSAWAKVRKKAAALFVEMPPFNRPYNHFKFLEIYSKGVPIKYTWGDPSFVCPPKVEILYFELLKIVPKPN